MRTLVLFVVGVICVGTCAAQLWNVSIASRAIYSVEADPSNPSLLYAGNVSRTFLKSTDGGVTWEERLIGDGGGNSLIMLFKVHPDASNILYAGGSGFNGLDMSTDYGETWTNVLTSSDGSRFELASSSSMAFHPTQPDTAFVIRLSNGVVYRSINAGRDWDSLGVPPNLQGTDKMRAITVCPDSAHVLLAGGRLAYVYRSTDGGSTWAAATGAIAPQPDMDIANFAWSPSTPGTVYATAMYSLRQNPTNGGLIKSTDYGVTWSRYRCTDTSLYALLINNTPNGDEIFLGGNQIDFPPDSGYIKGDSVVLRYKVSDSSLHNLSDVPWTENEIGEVGTNVWGFAIAMRSGVPTLLMASTGGLFSSDYLTSTDEPPMYVHMKDLRVTSSHEVISLILNIPPGESMYRILSLDGRIVAEGFWQGASERLDIPFNSNGFGVYLAEIVSGNDCHRTLFVR